MYVCMNVIKYTYIDIYLYFDKTLFRKHICSSPLFFCTRNVRTRIIRLHCRGTLKVLAYTCPRPHSFCPWHLHKHVCMCMRTYFPDAYIRVCTHDNTCPRTHSFCPQPNVCARDKHIHAYTHLHSQTDIYIHTNTHTYTKIADIFTKYMAIL